MSAQRKKWGPLLLHLDSELAAPWVEKQKRIVGPDATPQADAGGARDHQAYYRGFRAYLNQAKKHRHDALADLVVEGALEHGRTLTEAETVFVRGGLIATLALGTDELINSFKGQISAQQEPSTGSEFATVRNGDELIDIAALGRTAKKGEMIEDRLGPAEARAFREMLGLAPAVSPVAPGDREAMLTDLWTGDDVRAARELLGLSLSELAGRVGVRKATIIDIENGRTAKMQESTRNKLAAVLVRVR